MQTIEDLFINKNWFPIVDKIGYETLRKFQQYLENLDGNIKILFNTEGGSITRALQIIDLINLYKEIKKVEVQAFCIGECSSSGIIILSACDKNLRESAPYTRFHFHSHRYTPDFPFDGSAINVSEIAKIVENETLVVEKALEQEMKGFGLSREEVISLRQNGDKYGIVLFPDKLKEVGIISKIVISPSNF